MGNSNYIPPIEYELIKKEEKDGYKVSSFQPFGEPNIGGNITIPGYHENLPVLEIDQFAFFENNLDSITIEETDHSINILSDAFNSCTVDSINLSNSVTFNDSSVDMQKFEIDNGKSINVFTNSDIRSITLPSNMTMINQDMFSQCSSLSQIKVAQTSQTNILPSGISRISTQAFSDCLSLPSLLLPEGLTEIGENVFAQWDETQIVTFSERRFR